MCVTSTEWGWSHLWFPEETWKQKFIWREWWQGSSKWVVNNSVNGKRLWRKRGKLTPTSKRDVNRRNFCFEVAENGSVLLFREKLSAWTYSESLVFDNRKKFIFLNNIIESQSSFWLCRCPWDLAEKFCHMSNFSWLCSIKRPHVSIFSKCIKVANIQRSRLVRQINWNIWNSLSKK